MKEALVKAKNKQYKELDIQESLGLCAQDCKGCKYLVQLERFVAYGDKSHATCSLFSTVSAIDKVLKLSERENK